MPPPPPMDPRLRCDPPQTTVLSVEIEDGHESNLKVSNLRRTNAASLNDLAFLFTCTVLNQRSNNHLWGTILSRSSTAQRSFSLDGVADPP